MVVTAESVLLANQTLSRDVVVAMRSTDACFVTPRVLLNAAVYYDVEGASHARAMVARCCVCTAISFDA